MDFLYRTAKLSLARDVGDTAKPTRTLEPSRYDFWRSAYVKALFITHFYPPEPAAAATRVASFVDALANAGHDVTVVTNYPSFPRGRFSERRLPLMRREKTERTRTVRLFSLLASRSAGQPSVALAERRAVGEPVRGFDARQIRLDPDQLASDHARASGDDRGLAPPSKARRRRARRLSGRRDRNGRVEEGRLYRARRGAARSRALRSRRPRRRGDAHRTLADSRARGRAIAARTRA